MLISLAIVVRMMICLQRRTRGSYSRDSPDHVAINTVEGPNACFAQEQPVADSEEFVAGRAVDHPVARQELVFAEDLLGDDVEWGRPARRQAWSESAARASLFALRVNGSSPSLI